MKSAQLADLEKRREALRRIKFSGASETSDPDSGSVRFRPLSEIDTALAALDAEIARLEPAPAARRPRRIVLMPDRRI